MVFWMWQSYTGRSPRIGKNGPFTVNFGANRLGVAKFIYLWGKN